MTTLRPSARRQACDSPGIDSRIAATGRRFLGEALAEMAGMHISQIRRYEAGQSQPTLDAIRKLAMALRVSAELKLQFEAVSRLDPEEKKIIRSVIESMILRHEAKRWSNGD